MQISLNFLNFVCKKCLFIKNFTFLVNGENLFFILLHYNDNINKGNSMNFLNLFRRRIPFL